MRYQTEDGVASFEFATYETGRQILQPSSSSGQIYKKHYAPSIQQMKAQEMSQKDIAFTLGISESYVSQILRRKN